MKLYPPLSISARLLPAVHFNTFTVSLDPSTWEYFIDFHGEASGTVEIVGSDFSPGLFMASDGDTAIREAMGTLLSFVEAFAESVDYAQRTGENGENADLFPERFAQWAAMELDEISMTRFDLEEGA
jgi:hypothetical protein